MSKRNTNVPGSIAGYYYQILLACREVTNENTEILEVGVEANADVRVFYKQNKKKSIEAKFHKEGFSKYDAEIVKTIYNFFSSYEKDEEMVFETNQKQNKTTSINFFDDWNNKTLTSLVRVKYIKECLLKFLINKDADIKKKFEKYLESTKKEKKEVIDLIIDSTTLFTDFVIVNTSVDILEFSNNLSFKFGDNKKSETIGLIKHEVTQNISKHAKASGVELTGDDSHKILNNLLDKFMGLAVANSSKGKKVDEFQLLSTNEFILEISNFDKYKENIHITNQISEIFNKIEIEEKSFVEDIELRFTGEQAELLIDKYIKMRNIIISSEFSQKELVKLAKKFSLDSSDFQNVLQSIYHATSISYHGDYDVDKFSMVNEDDIADNIKVENLFAFQYIRNSSLTVQGTSRLVTKWLYYMKNTASISDNQVVVFNSKFRAGKRPCETNLKTLMVTINNLGDFDKEFIERNLCTYKCTECLDICDSVEAKSDYIKFKECGGLND